MVSEARVIDKIDRSVACERARRCYSLTRAGTLVISSAGREQSFDDT